MPVQHSSPNRRTIPEWHRSHLAIEGCQVRFGGVLAVRQACISPPSADPIAPLASRIKVKLGARAGGDDSAATSTRAPSVCARLPASQDRGPRPALRWSRKDPDAERAMAAQSAAGGRAFADGSSPAIARRSRAPLSQIFAARLRIPLNRLENRSEGDLHLGERRGGQGGGTVEEHALIVAALFHNLDIGRPYFKIPDASPCFSRSSSSSWDSPVASTACCLRPGCAGQSIS